jgi:signal peptidase
MIRRLLDLALLLLVVSVLVLVLLANLLPSFGHQLVIIRGGSMSPAIPMGAIVDEAAVPLSQIHVGDVISYNGQNSVVVTHRVVGISTQPDGLYFQVKGDANNSPDPDLVPGTAVTGVAQRTAPLLGFLLYMLTTPSGIVSIICLALTMWLAIWLLEEADDGEGDGNHDGYEYESELARVLDAQRSGELIG